MTTYYVDSSALVKRYIDEIGSDWVRTALGQHPLPSVVIVNLAIVEMTSALARRRRNGLLAPLEYTHIQDAFRSDCLNEYRIIAAVDSVIDEANRLLEQYPLRAYDAVHLAAASVTNQHLRAEDLAPLTFLSADEHLNDAATAEGIVVDNPNHHR